MDYQRQQWIHDNWSRLMSMFNRSRHNRVMSFDEFANKVYRECREAGVLDSWHKLYQ